MLFTMISLNLETFCCLTETADLDPPLVIMIKILPVSEN